MDDDSDNNTPRGLQISEDKQAINRKRDKSAVENVLYEINKELENMEAINLSTYVENLNEMKQIINLNPKTFAYALYMYYNPYEINMNSITSEEFNDRFEELNISDTNRIKTKINLLKYIRLYNNYILEK